MDKLIFAHQLRAIAALSVVISHLVGVFWGLRDVVASAIAAPVQQAPFPSFAIIAFQPNFNFGPFGVALFFLVSGFVISFSVRKMDRLSFLIARFFRIFPVYFVCTAVTLTVIFAATFYWGTSLQIDPDSLIANLFLIHNYLGIKSIDEINWSLAVEIKFYLIAALIAPLLIKQKLWPLYLISGLILLSHFEHQTIFEFFSGTEYPYLLNQLFTELLYISFMLIGVLFYYHYTGGLKTAGFIVCLAIFLGAFVFTWKSGVLAVQYWSVTINYLYAFVVFTLAYLARGFFRPVFILDKLTDISYPLYVLHSLIGYTLLNILMDNNIGYAWALPISIAIILALSYLIHLFVEQPTIALGRKFTKRRRQDNTTAPSDYTLASQPSSQ